MTQELGPFRSFGNLYYKRVKQQFHWPRLKEAVHTKVQQCEVCQVNKSQHGPSPGLLQPVQVPEEAWAGIQFVINNSHDRKNEQIHFACLTLAFFYRSEQSSLKEK